MRAVAVLCVYWVNECYNVIVFFPEDQGKDMIAITTAEPARCQYRVVVMVAVFS